MNSIWTENINKPKFSPLEKNINTDVLIIGGGISGILCAYILKEKGVDCMLVEAKEICSGASQNTTAKITIQHGLIYDNLIKKFGFNKAKLYLEAQKNALDEYSRLCKSIECDYETKDSFVYSLNDKEKIEKEAIALNQLGEKAKFLQSVDIPLKIAGAVEIKKQGQFHPLKFLFEIAKELSIYENTKVLEISPQKAITQNGIINCKNIVIATHFPILNKHGGYFLKMFQHRSYVIALENAENVNGMYVDESKKGLSFRNYKNLLLLGGGSHRTGKNGGNWRELENFARLNYPNSRIVGKWAAQDCITLDSVPYIGKYSSNTLGIYVATGFNKWGMTSSMVAAKLLSDLICNKKNKYEALFCPSRSIFHPMLFSNVFESMLGIIKPTTPRCPHMGCALQYNKDEHSWDCPCHGSRFTEKGKLIDNPATDDKNISR